MSLSRVRRCLSANISQRYFSLRMLDSGGQDLVFTPLLFELSLSLSLQLASQKKNSGTLASESVGECCVIGYFQPKLRDRWVLRSKLYVVFQGKSSSHFTMFEFAISVNNFQPYAGNYNIKYSFRLYYIFTE